MRFVMTKQQSCRYFPSMFGLTLLIMIPQMFHIHILSFSVVIHIVQTLRDALNKAGVIRFRVLRTSVVHTLQLSIH